MITQAMAERVLDAVRKHFPAYIDDGNGPKLVQDYDGAPWAIVWEYGSPYEWAYLFTAGGVDEEMTSLAQEFLPGHVSKVDTAEPVPGVHLEPIMSFILGIYEQ